jgi:hypothetical protein
MLLFCAGHLKVSAQNNRVALWSDAGSRNIFCTSESATFSYKDNLAAQSRTTQTIDYYRGKNDALPGP